jgi:hypothetical protein
MTHRTHLLITIGLALTILSAAVLAQTANVRGLDFRTYLSLQRDMTEGQILSIAGQPDVLADEGVAFSDQTPTRQVREQGRTALAVKSYTYLPTAADPYTTTITFVDGQVTEIQRDGKFATAQTTDARGLDFRTYLSLQRSMTEGQVLSIAGQPDVRADQGLVFVDQSSTAQVRAPERTALAVRTYTYLPTAADPYTTTITFVGGRVTDIRRDQKF